MLVRRTDHHYKRLQHLLVNINELHLHKQPLHSSPVKNENTPTDWVLLPLCLCSPQGFPPRAQNFPDWAAQPDASLPDREDHLGREHRADRVLLGRRCVPIAVYIHSSAKPSLSVSFRAALTRASARWEEIAAPWQVTLSLNSSIFHVVSLSNYDWWWQLRITSMCCTHIHWLIFPGCLALPKLNLQFLTLHDYLLRNFNLFRLESTYEIRQDIEDVVWRMKPW